MKANLAVLHSHLETLSLGYALSVSDDYRFVILHDFKLPPGYNRSQMDLLIDIPKDYPISPPGVGSSRIYVPAGLRYQDKVLKAVYTKNNPGWGDWAWMCYKSIQWSPNRDDLVSLTEMIRADLTNPPTIEKE